jgi:hypothetical protein
MPRLRAEVLSDDCHVISISICNPWLFAVPIFSTYTRHYALTWSKWNPSIYKIEDVSADYRQRLRRKACLEYVLYMSTVRLRSSKVHEQGAIRYRADYVGPRYQAYLTMDPFVKLESEMMMILILLRMSPFHLHEPLAQQADACYVIQYRLRHDIYQLRDLHPLQHHKHGEHIAFKKAVVDYCFKKYEEDLRRDVNIRSAEWCRGLKNAHHAASSTIFRSLAPMFEDVPISPTQRAKKHVVLRKERYAYTELLCDSRPVQ